MKLDVQKRLAGQILGCSTKRVVFDTEQLDDIKNAITRGDIRRLINSGVIKETQKAGVSRVRANLRKKQKAKGLQKGQGSRKGKKTARTPRKMQWMIKIRLQRRLLKELYAKNYLGSRDYRMMYRRAKSGFFRNKRHIKIFIQDHNLIQKSD